MTKTAPDELLSLLDWKVFQEHHQGLDGKLTSEYPEFDRNLRRFLSSTMDEVRTTSSGKVALHVLSITGISEFGEFRTAVLHRELTGTIAYEKHRDHSAHTLYNYLLGWYFLQNCTRITTAVAERCKLLGIPNCSHGSMRSVETFFGCVWPYASLLHDIGYMFEGALRTLDPQEDVKHSLIGARRVGNYFDFDYWFNSGLEVTSGRDALLNELKNKVRLPEFRNLETLRDIANALRNVGIGFESLTAAVRREFGAPKGQEELPSEGFSGDAFDLWTAHYQSVQNAKMNDRVASARRVFNALVTSGMPKMGIRLLDHGVCSGLLQLLAATQHYQLLAEAHAQSVPGPYTLEFVKEKSWSPKFWWAGILWGTAACAIHNLQQMESIETLDPKWPKQLSLDEDPLAYLGVLIDIVEEWDRYSVRKSVDSEPLQGNEVRLSNSAGKIRFEFTGPSSAKVAKKVRKALDDSLDDWGGLVEI